MNKAVAAEVFQFVVGDTPVRHNGQVYQPGQPILLTEQHALALGHHVRLPGPDDDFAAAGSAGEGPAGEPVSGTNTSESEAAMEGSASVEPSGAVTPDKSPAKRGKKE